MGFFSWITQDTRKSISNSYSSKSTFPVIMHDNNGTKYIENNYEGYGVFGGKDYFELLAEMNGLGSDRDAGVSFYYSCDGHEINYPNLTETIDWEWRNIDPERCPHQGYFYVYEDEDSEDLDYTIKY